MYKRVLLAGLVAAGLLAGVGPGQALSRNCREAATAMVGASDIARGHATYTATVVPGLPDAIDESGIVAETDRSSGTLTAWMEFGEDVPAKACSNLTYTLYVLDPESDVKLPTLAEDPAVLASTATAKRVNDGFRLEFSVDVPEHAGTCVHVYATTANAATALLDRAPDLAPTTNEETYNTPCATDEGGGGSQYWN